MIPSLALLDFLEDHSLPWVRYDHDERKLILVVDNHLLSTYRACPQHFFFSNAMGLRRKPINPSSQRVWFLDIGILIHKMLEIYYQQFKTPGFDANHWAISRGAEEWRKMEMEVHAEEKEYKALGGLGGFMTLLLQYGHTYPTENFRVLGTEIAFGKNKEVPLYLFPDLEIYLAGRIDLLIDDGYFICPMDHKTKAAFKGDLSSGYSTDEGPTGYIYALHNVLPQLLPEKEILKRDCNRIVMNLISKAPTKEPTERFKRIQLLKTTWQLQVYKDRMVSTSFKLLRDLERFVQDAPLDRNTVACENWMRRPCTFVDICRQVSREGQLATIQNGFSQGNFWDTEEVQPTS